jgi:hypothetical protein
MGKEQIQPVSKNIIRLSSLDIPGGGQVTVNNGLAFVGHMDAPNGTTIIDVKEPSNPKILKQIFLDDELSHTHKVRVAGNIMITNVEQAQRHLLRRGEKLPDVTRELTSSLGRPPLDKEIAEALGLSENKLSDIRKFLANGYNDGGFRVWDISDPRKPELLSYVRTHGFGVHRFDMDEKYAYISTEMEGYIGNILVIYDLADPRNPTEVSRWHMPGQHLAGGEKPFWKGYKNRLHHALRIGDELWAAVWNAGFQVIDISDIRKPITIASHNYHPPFPEPTHTALPCEQLIDGRRIAVVVDEEHEHTPGQPHAFLWIFDVSDTNKIQALSTFYVRETESPWSTHKGRFGAHQFREKIDGTLIYVTWFSGGLRVVDIADPFLPKEIAHYIPTAPDKFPSPQSNDVDVDENGVIYLLDRNRGLEILKLENSGL